MFEKLQEKLLFQREQFHQHHKYQQIHQVEFLIAEHLGLMNKQFVTMHDIKFHPK